MEAPIKIRMTGDSRSKLQSRGIVPAWEDGDDDAEAAFNALNRQKTNIVMKTEQEARGVLRGVEKMTMRHPRSCTWMTGPHMRAFERVERELISELKERELCGFEPDTSVTVDCPTDGCNSVVSGERGDTAQCFICNTEFTVEI